MSYKKNVLMKKKILSKENENNLSISINLILKNIVLKKNANTSLIKYLTTFI